MDTVSPAHPCCSLHQTRAHIHVHYCTDTHDYVGIIHSEGIHTYMYVHYECLVLQNANCSLSESIESKHRASSYIHMYSKSKQLSYTCIHIATGKNTHRTELSTLQRNEIQQLWPNYLCRVAFPFQLERVACMC